MSEFSKALRNGMAESLALIGTSPESIVNRKDPPEWTAVIAVRSLLGDADAKRWIDLGEQLPDLAEAAPDAFLEAIEHLLLKDETIKALFAQEGKGFMGGSNPLVPILWSLETLAWETQYLQRVTLDLGGLDQLDPGGSWSNRAKNSLINIFLPWHPQTTATASERFLAMDGLSREFSSTAWSVLLAMLPGATQTASGTRRPKWRKSVPDDLSVSMSEYWEQVHAYAARLVAMADSEERLLALADKLDKLPDEAFSNVESRLRELVHQDISDATRYALWQAIDRLAARHSRFANADWAMGEERLNAVAALAKLFEPISNDRYRRLFSRSSYELLSGMGDISDQEALLAREQERAVGEVYEVGGWEAVIDFARSVDRPYGVGWSAGSINTSMSEKQLRSLASQPETVIDFLGGYLARGIISGKRALSTINFGEWEPEHAARVLSRIAITDRNVWQVAEAALGERRDLYWSKANFHLLDDLEDLHHVVGELLKVGRPLAAIRLIYLQTFRDHTALNVDDAVTALLAAITSTEDAERMDSYEITGLIEILQKDASVSRETLSKIEWAYLALLEGGNETAPITLEFKLASEPSFYCEVIRAAFRSDKAPKNAPEPTKSERQIATNAYRLLSEWKRPPGTLEDGSFDGKRFSGWLNSVVDECSDTGHLVVAMHQLGPVLTHVPADSSGFWIDVAVAEEMNRVDMEELRSGYRMGLFNSRGVHFVDPSGTPELELSRQYEDRANAAELRGFPRLAATMRALSKEYRYDADRVRETHGYEDPS